MNNSAYLLKTCASDFECLPAHISERNFHDPLNNLSDEKLYNLIDKGIDQATSYNIIDRNDTLQYLEFMICFGHDFDSSMTWAKKILTIRNLSGSREDVSSYAKKSSCQGVCIMNSNATNPVQPCPNKKKNPHLI